MIGNRVLADVLGIFTVLVLPFSVVATLKSPQRRFWLTIVAIIPLPPLVFTNLYVVHDYYLAAITPAAAAFVGLGAGFVWDLTERRRVARCAAVVAGVAALLAGPIVDRDYLRPMFAPEPDPHIRSLARELRRHTSSADRIGVLSVDWSPAVLYYANRWGLMVQGSPGVSLDTLHRDGYGFILVRDALRADVAGLRRWRWVSALDAHLYGVSDAEPDLDRQAAVATDDVGAIATGRQLLSRRRVDCNRRSSVPSGRHGTVVVLGTRPAKAEISIGSSFAPLPAQRLIYAAPSLEVEGRVLFRCTGADAIMLSVWEAAPS